jgi:hypothetical protein
MQYSKPRGGGIPFRAAVRANFSKGLDLVAPKGLRTKPWLELDRLLAEDWHKVNDAKHESQSQAFGRAAHDIGAEALLVPSARVAGGMNLVYFPQSLGRGSKVEIFGENDLSVANCYSRSNWRFEQAVAAGLPGVIV